MLHQAIGELLPHIDAAERVSALAAGGHNHIRAIPGDMRRAIASYLPGRRRDYAPPSPWQAHMYSRYYTNNKLNGQFAADYPECEGASASKFIGDVLVVILPNKLGRITPTSVTLVGTSLNLHGRFISYSNDALRELNSNSITCPLTGALLGTTSAPTRLYTLPCGLEMYDGAAWLTLICPETNESRTLPAIYNANCDDYGNMMDHRSTHGLFDHRATFHYKF